jgi:hypothetical protein
MIKVVTLVIQCSFFKVTHEHLWRLDARCGDENIDLAPKLQMLSDETSKKKGHVLKQKTRSSTNMTKAYLLKTPPQDFHAGCVVFLIADPRVYETELLFIPTKNNYNLLL